MYKKNRHSSYILNYSLTFTTKDKISIIDNVIANELNKIVKKLIENRKGTLTNFHFESFYIKFEFSIPPKVELSSFVNGIKSVSSREIRKKYSDLISSKIDEGFWRRNYLLVSIGTVETNLIETYINESDD